MARIMNVHYVDKAAFMEAKIVENEEEVLTFVTSPNYEEVVE